MGFIRISDKVLSRARLDNIIDNIFELRESGLPQQEVAERVGCDRSFVSRLESLAEIRKGGTLAIIGFPLANTTELKEIATKLGVDYTMLLNDEERWELLRSFDGPGLLDWIMDLMVEMSSYDHVIMIGSDMRIRLAETILGEKVMGILIGESPIKDDYYLDPVKLKELITATKGE